MTDKLDPAVNLPDSVKRQIAHGQAVREALEKGEVPPPSDVPPNVTLKGDIAQTPTAPETPTHPTRIVLPDPKKTAPPPSSAETDDAHDADDDRVSKVLAQLRTLQGKYNNEIPRLQNDKAVLQERLDNANRLIAELTAKLSFQPPPEKNLLTGSSEYATLSPEDEEAFGDPALAKAVDRRARTIANQLVSDKLSELQARIDQIDGSVNTLGKNAKLSNRERCASYLSQHLPGWEVINEDPLFIAWLKEEDPLSGRGRGLIFQEAVESGNFNRVKLIFEGYSREQDALLAPTPKPNGGKAGRVKADTLAAPSGGRSEVRTPPAPTTPEVLTGEAISAFYTKLTQKNHGLSDTEIADMENRIWAALQSNRVVSRPRV